MDSDRHVGRLIVTADRRSACSTSAAFQRQDRAEPRDSRPTRNTRRATTRRRRSRYEKLAAEYPSSDEHRQVQVLRRISSGMQIVVRAVTNREDPDAAVERFEAVPRGAEGLAVREAHVGFRPRHLRRGQETRRGRGRARRRPREGVPRRPQREVRANSTRRQGDRDRPRAACRCSNRSARRTTRRSTESAREFDRVEADGEAGARPDRGDREARSPVWTTPIRRDDSTRSRTTSTAAGFERRRKRRRSIAAAKGTTAGTGEVRARSGRADQPARERRGVDPVRRSDRSDAPAPPAGVGEVVRRPCSSRSPAASSTRSTRRAGTLLWAVRVGADMTDPPTVARVDLDERADRPRGGHVERRGQPALSRATS